MGFFLLLIMALIHKSTNNLSFLCQFFVNEITASDAGPDIIRSHLLRLRSVAAGIRTTNHPLAGRTQLHVTHA